MCNNIVTLRPDLRDDTPLTKLDLTLFADGSYCKNERGIFQAGYAVTTEYELPERGNLPRATSAQWAELCAWLSKGQIVNTDTDSWYASGVIHDLRMLQ